MGRARFELLRNLSFNELKDSHKAIQYADELIAEAATAKDDEYLLAGYILKAQKQRKFGNYDGALTTLFVGLAEAQSKKLLKSELQYYNEIASVYSENRNQPKAVGIYHQAINALGELKNRNDSNNYASFFLNIGDSYLISENYDSSFWYSSRAKAIFDKTAHAVGIGYSLGNIGMIYAKTGKSATAEQNLKRAIGILENTEDNEPVCTYLLTLAELSNAKGDAQSALNYASKSLYLAEQQGLVPKMSDAHLTLSNLYEKSGKYDDAFTHFKSHIFFRDSVFSIARERTIGELNERYQESQNKRALDLAKQKQQSSRTLTIALIIILALALIILAGLFRNIRNRKKAYKILDTQKLETERQRAKAEEALTELQVTQKQLIHSAKMASLGELTAGIAHEIQNPLNFVNNFSELNVDLLNELQQNSINKLNEADKAEAHAIITDLSLNLKKISDHGKRADSIVKGMLQHSRVSDNKKVLTDINALADEYLRLSYHGLRSKDTKNAIAIETTFDDKIEEFLLVPQDIGRVLINIYSNAFYALNEKAKLNIKDYEPKIWVTTKAILKEGKFKGARINIKDNGMGIPDTILDKIYQPFFTTKPPGQGTGLGLSLSYDIITNGHKGSLKVLTQEREYTEFIIELPAKDGEVQNGK